MQRTSRARSDRPLDLAALKFIRMVMASYFIALSVDVIHGVDTGIFFAPFMSNETAALVGSSITLYCAALLFFGLFLRLASLYLAIMVLTASIVQNFFQVPPGSVDAFWRDLVVVCGLLLTYCTLSPRDLRRQAFIMQQIPQTAMNLSGRVTPRRVAPANPEEYPSKPLKLSKPEPKETPKPGPKLVETKPEAPEPKTDPYSKLKAKEAEAELAEEEDEVVNIFAA